jgi:hypothetical protein
MSNKQSSSIDWFAKESWKLRVELEDEKISLGEYANKYYQLKEQAKAMHKEEIMDANFYGQRLHAKSVTNTMMEDNAEQYYNETFGGEQ